MKHKNKQEHLPIKNQKKIRFSFGKLEIFVYIHLKKFDDNNLIVYKKLERWLNYFKYNLYDI